MGLPVKLYSHASQVVWVLVVFHLRTAGNTYGIDLVVGVGWVVTFRGYAGEVVAVYFVGIETVYKLGDDNLVLIDIALLVGEAFHDVVVNDDERGADFQLRAVCLA